MNIAIIDISTKNHVSLIENWIEVARYNRWQVYLFVSSDVLSALDKKSLVDVHMKEFKGGNAISFLNEVYALQRAGKVNKVVITSLQSNFFSFYFSKITKCYVILSLHNINAWLGKCRKDTLKYKAKYFIRRLLFNKTQAFVVSAESLRSYLTSNISASKEIFVMPFKLSKENITEHKRDYIVYPGIVAKERKSYAIFYQLCLKNPNLKFVLLGAGLTDADQQLIIKFSKLDNVITFDSYVIKEEFDFYISRAKVIFGYINVDYEFQEYKEVYGVTKDTGLSYFSVENNIPLLVNKEFSNIPNLEKMTIKYSNIEDAQIALDSIVNSDVFTYFELNHEYSVDYVAKMLSKI